MIRIATRKTEIKRFADHLIRQTVHLSDSFTSIFSSDFSAALSSNGQSVLSQKIERRKPRTAHKARFGTVAVLWPLYFFIHSQSVGVAFKVQLAKQFFLRCQRGDYTSDANLLMPFSWKPKPTASKICQCGIWPKRMPAFVPNLGW